MFSDEYVKRIQRELYGGLHDLQKVIKANSNFPPAKRTYKDIWGKEVVRTRDGKVVDRHDLELWTVTAYFTGGTNSKKIFDDLFSQVIAKEVANCPNGHADGHDCTCYMLGEWLWLDDNKGHIIRKEDTPLGSMYSATLVTYAKILPDLEVKDE